jgi:hypothetical protein
MMSLRILRLPAKKVKIEAALAVNGRSQSGPQQRATMMRPLLLPFEFLATVTINNGEEEPSRQRSVCVLPTVPLDDAFVLEENLSHLFNLIENLSLQERKTIRRTIPSIIYNPIQSCHILIHGLKLELGAPMAMSRQHGIRCATAVSPLPEDDSDDKDRQERFRAFGP